MAGNALIGRDGTHSQALGLLILPLVDEFAYLSQALLGQRVDVVVGATAPKGVFVQLDGVAHQSAIDHGSQSSVTQRQCLHPMFRRAVVPQGQIPLTLLLATTGCTHHSQRKNKTVYQALFQMLHVLSVHSFIFCRKSSEEQIKKGGK